jgi:DNA-binding transcriptional regulator YiaG
METIDDAAITELMQQGLSQRAIADRLNISRTTLRRHLDKQKSVPRETIGTPQPKPDGTPSAYPECTFADELTRSWGELQEVLDWWRERKQSLAHALDTTRKRRRQTYHVEERYIEAIRRAADLERTDLAEIVNRAFARYFADRQNPI